jgi:polar amino acid transport system substrate-binding protein
MKNKLMFLCIISIFSFSVMAKEIKIAVGLSLPPYIIKGSDTGIEVDIVREALKYSGHTIKLVYLPFARAKSAIADGAAEAAMTINESSGAKGHYSETHISYRNGAVTLAKNGFKINSVADLKGKKAIGFMNAHKYLGADFAAFAKGNKKYSEKNKQEVQDKMLYAGKIDAAIGDINIFKFFAKKVAGKVDTTQKITFHPIFPPTPYKVLFKDSKLKDDFNKGLNKLKAAGKIEAIFAKYVK